MRHDLFVRIFSPQTHYIKDPDSGQGLLFSISFVICDSYKVLSILAHLIIGIVLFGCFSILYMMVQ